MDDFNIKTISDAKNEYTITLINILTPNIIKGVKSIFKEALDLCIQNDEKNKYLMTFQNFLTRVPKWNQTIVDNESNRIILESNCNYLEDLITCVHITQLKILTSIRVSNKQKKINIEIPKINNFIHKIYINYARKLYSNIFLFDITISSLEIQKNNRELEIICKECILNTIRNNIPIEKILNAYIDETNEDEIIETFINDISGDDVKELEKKIDNENKEEQKEKEEKEKEEIINNKLNNTIDKVEKILVNKQKIEEHPPLETENINKQIIEKINNKLEENNKIEQNTKTEEKNKKKDTPLINNNYEKSENSKLLFNNNDTLIEYDTQDKTNVSISNNQINAPKDIDILEKISEKNYAKRKLEQEDSDEEYNDRLTIDMSSKPLNNIELEIETL